MLLLLLLLAVTCCTSSDHHDSLIEKGYPNYPTHDLAIYWNAPSFMCHKYGINFAEHTKRYGIIANHNDSFRGSNFNILYDPGAFPAVLKSSKGRTLERNGGIPQLGNITYHLEALTYVINQLIPKSYSGIGVIDFEAWRPIFRQNFGDQTIYTNMSKDLARQKYPQYDEKRVESEAAHQFERSSKVFLESSLKLVKYLRPHGKWGYYGYPYCYNYRQNTGMKSSCSKTVQRENNKIQWLFDGSDALFPSLYMGRKPAVDAKGYVAGRMNEAVRVAWKVTPDKVPEINPYMWYKYFDSLNFLTEGDLYNTMETVRKFKAGGFILWGSSNDFSTEEKCKSVLSYLQRVIGPTIQRVRSNARISSIQSPADDEEIQFVSLDGEKIILGSNNQEADLLESTSHDEQRYQLSDSGSKPKLSYPGLRPRFGGNSESKHSSDDRASKNTDAKAHLREGSNSISSGVGEASGSGSGPTFQIPNAVIYSAVAENGTTRTVYKYPGAPPDSTYRIIAVPDTDHPNVAQVATTTKKAVRSTDEDFSDVPLLKEYMKGFESALNSIVKRWSKAFKRK